MESVAPVLLLGLAGFSFGGTYALYSQQRPIWVMVLLSLFGLLCLLAGWLYV